MGYVSRIAISFTLACSLVSALAYAGQQEGSLHGHKSAVEHQAEPCLTLVYDSSLGPAKEPLQNFYNILYRRAGLCARYVAMRSKRAEHQLRVGAVDGDWSRVAGFADYMGDDVIALKQPIFALAAYFVWLNDVSAFTGRSEDLAGRRVGFPAGFRWLEWNLPKQGARAVPLPVEAQILNLLDRNRIDIFATSEVHLRLLGQNNTLASPYSVAKWQDVPLFHLLHVRHKHLVPKLNAILAEMARSGEMMKLLDYPGLLPVWSGAVPLEGANQQ